MPPSAADVAQKLRRMARNLKDGLARAEQSNTEDAARLARLYSRGQLTAADLRRLGHPYRKGGNPPADPAIINRRSGAFQSGWRTQGPRESAAGDLMAGLVNTAPHAGYLLEPGPKSRMMPRPILARIAQVLQSQRLRRLTDALQLTLKF